jgi:DNA-binding LytR/AlgR family response regulator
MIAAESPMIYKTTKTLSKENESFFIRFQKVTTKIKFCIITVITKEKKILTIETSTGQLYFHESNIKETAAKLPPEYLVRINNATIINLNYIDKIQKNVVYMNSRMFTVSRSYYFQFKNSANALLKKD